jgi:hypothetical protein
MDATALLIALAPFGVTGVSIPDPADAATWRFDATPPLTDEQRIDVVALIQAQLAPVAKTTLTKRRFFAAIQPEELKAVVVAAAGGDATALYGLEVLRNVPDLDLTDPLLTTMLDYFATAGFVTADRVAEITATLQKAAGLP